MKLGCFIFAREPLVAFERIERDDAAIEEIQMAALRLKAERPLFAALSNQKLTDAGVVMPSWQDALARYVAG